jgi:hypothetical protein
MTVVNFLSAADRLDQQLIDEMCAVVDGHPLISGLNACLQTLGILIAEHGEHGGDASGLAERCGSALSDIVAKFDADLKRTSAEQDAEATA